MKKFALAACAAAAAAVLMTPQIASAESTLNATGTGNATARLDFRVTIPRVLYLRVGSGAAGTDGTVNLIDFTVPAADLGNGTAVAATAGSGDLGNGAVTVRVYGNNGDITLNSATTGPLNNGVATDVLPWSQITVAEAALPAASASPTAASFTNAAIAHPAFNLGAAGGNGTAVTLTATNKVVRREGQWTYSYANANMIAAGTYGGVNTNAGRVTYTASMP